MYEIFRVEKYITLLLNLILGNRCEQDIDECSTTKPCRNGATCNNTHGSYVCWCPKGYEGRHCENNPDDCVPSRCFMCNGLNNLSVENVFEYRTVFNIERKEMFKKEIWILRNESLISVKIKPAMLQLLKSV